MEPKNYIELAPRAYTSSQPLVIEAIKLGTTLKILSPLWFLMRWDTVRAEGWKEVDHAPGPVTDEEWRELVSEGVL